jgi:hypothetical protein
MNRGDDPNQPNSGAPASPPMVPSAPAGSPPIVGTDNTPWMTAEQIQAALFIRPAVTTVVGARLGRGQSRP